MLRRCFRELPLTRKLATAPPRRIPSPVPLIRPSKAEFSSLSQRNQAASKASTENIPPKAQASSQSRSSVSGIVVGSAILGAAAIAAYLGGYVDKLYIKDEKLNNVLVNDERISLKNANMGLNKVAQESELASANVIIPGDNKNKPSTLPAVFEIVEKNNEPHNLKDLETNKKDEDIKISVEEYIPPEAIELAGNVQGPSEPKPELAMEPKLEESLVPDTYIDETLHHEVLNQSDEAPAPVKENTDGSPGADVDIPRPDFATVVTEDKLEDENEAYKSHVSAHHIRDDDSRSLAITKPEGTNESSVALSKDEEASLASGGVSLDKLQPEDGRILLDLLEAIHAAEKKQAESDANIYSEEKRKLKEKYEKALKDARARELMYAEEAAILDKELNREKGNTESSIKLIKEKAEQRLVEELLQREVEAERKLSKAKELAKAELAAAIANEKSSQLEKIAEANLHINALCMAFYASSEEARQTHSVHKLALGTLALEDALSKGLPIRAEVDALQKSFEGINKDSFIDLVLSSLPEETLHSGTSTRMQLKLKFDAIKGVLRHFSLIPSGGGGMLTHTVAYIASSIKVNEDGTGDGIEPLISKVDGFLADGKLSEAADALEVGLHGTEAAGAISAWVREARNRAVAEQALLLLHSYASSISLSFS